MKPLIGITTASHCAENGDEYHQAYAPNVRAIERAGGLPVLIPIGLTADNLQAIYARLDAVLLPGGGDVDPCHFGAEPHPQTKQIDKPRDETELTIARWAIADDRPLLGICRGHQVLNVAMGGTLIQDIPSQVNNALQHDTANSDVTHEIQIVSSSHLAHILGDTVRTVNSYHHQSVERTAPQFQVTAQSPDGIVEAMELPGKRFALSVQWHPEDMTDDAAMHRLFSEFVEAARERVTV